MAHNDDRHGDKPHHAGSGEQYRSGRISLEVAILASASEAEQRARREGNGDVLATVLVVAREPDMRAYVQGCLSGTPVRVVTATDLTSAVTTLAGARPDLLIVHRTTQETTGSARLADPQTAAGFAEVPIILLVDETAERNAGRAGDQAGVAVLFAPFNRQRLREEVERCLAGQHRE